MLDVVNILKDNVEYFAIHIWMNYLGNVITIIVGSCTRNSFHTGFHCKIFNCADIKTNMPI